MSAIVEYLGIARDFIDTNVNLFAVTLVLFPLLFAVAAFADARKYLIIGACSTLIFASLGWPTPLPLAVSGQVLGYQLADPVIYLYVTRPEQPPYSFAMPYSKEAANELTEMHENGQPFRFEPSLDPNKMFHPMPQPILPMKEPPPPPINGTEQGA